jgi:hypothetical protein
MVDSTKQRRRGVWLACEEAVYPGTEHLDRAPRLRRGQSGGHHLAAGTSAWPAHTNHRLYRLGTV